jgi:hypothetical protein
MIFGMLLNTPKVLWISMSVVPKPSFAAHGSHNRNLLFEFEYWQGSEKLSKQTKNPLMHSKVILLTQNQMF